MVAKIKIEPKDLAGKSEDEKLIFTCGLMLEELEKSALERDSAKIESLRKELTDKWADFEARQAEANPSMSLPGVAFDATGKKRDAFNYARAAVAVAQGDARIAPYEFEVFKAMDDTGWRQRAMSLTSDVGGGHLIPTEISAKIIEKLLPASIAFQLGAQTFDVGNVASLMINRETGTALAQWVGEMLTATKQDLTFSQMMLSPKALSAKADISNLHQLLGSNVAEERFMRSAQRQFGLAIDKAILIGAAGSKGPIGVANTIGVQSSSSATLTYDKLVDFQALVDTANVSGMKRGWAASVSQRTAVRKLKDSSNQPLLYRDVTAGGIQTVLGDPLLTTTQLGTTGANTLIYGVWEFVTLYRWFGGLLMSRTTASDNAMDNDLTRVALRMYADVGVDYPEAFVTASD